MTLAENSESQISEVKRAEICWTNYLSQERSDCDSR